MVGLQNGGLPLMIHWCAYCQKFLGEEFPFENKSFSHGMCKECAVRGFTWSKEIEEKIFKLAELNKKFWAAGISGDSQKMIELFKLGISMGLRSIDILYGITGPHLYQIGDLWEKNQLTVEEEQRFTASCEKIIELVRKEMVPNVENAQVLLTTAPGNEHVLGLSFFSIGLASIGVPSYVLKNDKTMPEFIRFVAEKKFKIIGFSAATDAQAETLRKFLIEFQKQSHFLGRIIIGGSAITKDFDTKSLSANVVSQISTVFDENTKNFWHWDPVQDSFNQTKAN